MRTGQIRPAPGIGRLEPGYSPPNFDALHTNPAPRSFSSAADLQAHLENLPEGSTGIVTGLRNDVSGHSFNAVKVNGQVHLLDAQNYGVPTLDGYDSFGFHQTGAIKTP